MENLGKYEIIEKIGEGGFGAVYRARDPHLKRIVALKTCSHDDEDLQRRFLREGEIVASLQHPHITLIHDLGFEGGTPFLVQEFLSGEDLAAIIRRRDELDDTTRIRWMIEIASGLEYAHQKGIVHRDIKPANIRILDDRTAKIMDFGIAKLAQHETRLTKAGSALGTIAYMAPEQLDGREADHRSDIFAFGVLAYEMFAYARPFDGETTSRIVFQILHDEPRRIETLSPHFEPGLDRILRLCLAKKPEERFQSFGEVLEALERLQDGLSPVDESTVVAGWSGPAASTAIAGSAGSAGASGASRTAAIAPGGPRTGAGGSASGAGAGVAPTVLLGPAGVGARPPQRRGLMIGGAVAASAVVATILWFTLGREEAVPAPAATTDIATSTAPAAVATDAPPAASVPVVEAALPSPGSAEAIPAVINPAPAAASGSRQSEVVTSLVERAERAAKSAMAAADDAGARRLAPSSFRAAERKLSDGAGALRRGKPEAAFDFFSAAQAGFEDSAREAALAGARALDAERRSAVAAPPPAAPSPIPVAPPSQNAEAQPVVKSTPPAALPVTPAANAETEIQHVLDRYVSAYERLDVSAVVAAVPSLASRRSDLERAFAQYRSLDMRLAHCRFEVAGGSTTATASCDKRQTFEPKVGQGRSVDSKVVFRLARRGGQWTIESVEG